MEGGTQHDQVMYDNWIFRLLQIHYTTSSIELLSPPKMLRGGGRCHPIPKKIEKAGEQYCALQRNLSSDVRLI